MAEDAYAVCSLLDSSADSTDQAVELLIFEDKVDDEHLYWDFRDFSCRDDSRQSALQRIHELSVRRALLMSGAWKI